jgi:hypothetical protein
MSLSTPFARPRARKTPTICWPHFHYFVAGKRTRMEEIRRRPGLSQRYDTLEEFAAIVITNIYRSENGREGLRRHHLLDEKGKDPPLSPPLTNPRTFLIVWRPQLERLQSELPLLCNQVAPIDCQFNPLFELYAAQNRFAPGTRRVIPR